MNKTWGAILVVLLCAISLGSCGEDSETAATVKANAGADQKALVGDTITLDGSSSSGVASVLWTLESKPKTSSSTLSGDSTLNPKLIPDVAGTYVVKLAINDNTSSAKVTITAKNVIAKITVPSGSALTSRTRFGNTETVVNAGQAGATLSSEPSLGSIASITWEQIAGPGATTTNGTSGKTITFTAPNLVDFLTESDKYKWQILPVSREDTKMVFKLSVSDTSGNTDSETFPVYLQDENLEIHTSSGLPNVGIGTTVYLSGPSLKAVSGASSTTLADWT